MMQSTAENPNASLVVLLPLQYRKEKIGAYYGSLIYTDLSKQPLFMRKHGERTGSTRRFNQRAIALPSIVTDRCAVEHSCWIVAAPLCAMDYINHARYLTGDTTLTAVKQLSPSRGTVLLTNKESLIAGSDLTNSRITTVMADKQILVGEELFVDYRRD